MTKVEMFPHLNRRSVIGGSISTDNLRKPFLTFRRKEAAFLWQRQSVKFFPQDNADTQGSISLSEPSQSRDAIGDAWAAYEKAKAKERMRATQNNYAAKTSHGNISIAEPTTSRDAIGARVGVNGNRRLKPNQEKVKSASEIFR